MTAIPRPLSDLCLPTIEQSDPREHPKQEIVYVDIGSINNRTKQIDAPKHVKGSEASVRARQIIRQDDILVSTVRPNLNAVARVPAELDGQFCSTGFCVLRCGEELLPEYLFAFVRSGLFVFAITELVKGALYPAITEKQVFAQMVPWIPVEGQKVMAGRLNAALFAISSAQAAVDSQLADIKSLRNLVISRKLSSDHLSARAKTFLTLGDHCSKIGSGSTPRGGHKSYIDNGIPLIRSQNVLMRSFTREGLAHISPEINAEMSGTEVEPGDVLLNITGASIGRVCVVPDDVCPANVNQHVCIIRCSDRIDPQFLMFLLSSPEFQKTIDNTQAGGTRQALTKADVMKFQVPALEIDEQRNLAMEIARQLALTDQMFTSVRLQLRELDSVPQKLLAQVFE
jgi:type I restriction enzyme S subunit